MQVTVISRKRPPIPVAGIRRLVETIGQGEGVPTTAALTVVVTDDREIQELNARFRGKRRPTNVLAFSNEMEPAGFPMSREDGQYLGDVVVSLDRARAEARQERVTVGERTLRLIAHGVLHLLGFDHQDDDQARVMAGKEQQYLGATWSGG